MPRKAKYMETNLQITVQAVKMGKSQMKAAKLYGFPRQTLQGRLSGAISMNAAKECVYRFSHPSGKVYL